MRGFSRPLSRRRRDALEKFTKKNGPARDGRTFRSRTSLNPVRSAEMSLVVDAEEHPPHANGVIPWTRLKIPPLDLDVEPETVADDPPKRTRVNVPTRELPNPHNEYKQAGQGIAEPLVLIGTMLSMTAPLPGAVVATRADVTAAALVKMAETRPGMMTRSSASAKSGRR